MEYIRKGVVLFVGYIVINVVLDAIFSELEPLADYLIQGLFFTVFVVVFWYLDDKGWNSWKRIGRLFRK